MLLGGPVRQPSAASWCQQGSGGQGANQQHQKGAADQPLGPHCPAEAGLQQSAVEQPPWLLCCWEGLSDNALLQAGVSKAVVAKAALKGLVSSKPLPAKQRWPRDWSLGPTRWWKQPSEEDCSSQRSWRCC